MYEGTLCGHWEAIVTLQQLVIIADEDGIVDMTPPAISAKTSIPLKIIETGLKVLSESDKYSRSTDHDGKRIILIDETRPWGWLIVNYAYYRNLACRKDKKRKDRERIALKRSKNKGVEKCRKVSPDVANVAHTNTNTNTKKKLIPDDFSLTDQMIEYAKKKGVTDKRSLEKFTENFIGSCKAKGYKYVDFYIAWQNWLRDAIAGGKFKTAKVEVNNW